MLGAPAEPPAPARRSRRDDRPRRHPGQRPARLHDARRGLPVPADRRRRARARADDADAAAGGDRRAVERRPPPTRDATSPSPTPGCRRSGCRTTILDSFPDEFREGMAARAEQLGDRGPSAPEHWEAGLGTGEAHVLVTVYAIDDEHLERRWPRCSARTPRRGASTLVHEQRAEALPGGRDHFGFFDGIAQPAVAGSGVRAAPGRRPARRRRRLARRRAPASSCSATSTRTARCPPRRPRRSTATARSSSTASCAWTSPRSGASSASAATTPAAPSCWRPRSSAAGRDGTPLARLARRARTPAIAGDPGAINDFSYADDPRRPALPARRPHPPRQPARRRRLLRRPAVQPPPHHPPRPRLRPAAARRACIEDDGVDRGLVFVCFNAEHLAPVRDHPGALDRRRRPVRPRPPTRTS